MTDCGGTCVDTQTDTMNCGACARDCGSLTCSAGVCSPEAIVADSGLRNFVVGASEIYYAHTAGVKKSPKTPAASLSDLATENQVFNLDADAAHVYFGNNIKLQRVPVGGGAKEQLGSEKATGVIKVTSTKVYVSSTLPSQVYRINKDGSGFDQMDTETSLQMAASATKPFWTFQTIADPGNGKIRTLNAINNPVGLVDGQKNIFNLEVVGGALRWLVVDNGLISRRSTLDGSTVTDEFTLAGFTVDVAHHTDTHIYWSNNNAGAYELWRVGLDGQGQVKLANDIGDNANLDSDATHVYWLTSNGSVFRTPL